MKEEIETWRKVGEKKRDFGIRNPFDWGNGTEIKDAS